MVDINELLEYLTKKIDFLQKEAVNLQKQHDEIEKQLKAYKQLLRMYRGVYESEAGVGLLNKLPTEIMEILEKKFGDDDTHDRKNEKKSK